jgi:hypothetical protein
VRGLLKGGLKLGVSSRGLGSLKEGKNGIMEVQDDFHLVTAADIVSDPSAYKAYVNAVMENKEYFFDAVSGTYIERVVENHHKQIKQMTSRQIEEKKVKFFNELLESLVRKPIV